VELHADMSIAVAYALLALQARASTASSARRCSLEATPPRLDTNVTEPATYHNDASILEHYSADMGRTSSTIRQTQLATTSLSSR
jgi:hypothetical protein